MHRVFWIVLLLALVWVSPAFADHEPGQCPQDRKTPQAPAEYLKLINPLKATEKRIKKGELIYQVNASPLQCKHCHGVAGNGAGHMEANPPARNFACSETMQSISDGQMFWAIKHGIPGTAMPAYPDLADWKIWVLIHYIRQMGQSEALRTASGNSR